MNFKYFNYLELKLITMFTIPWHKLLFNDEKNFLLILEMCRVSAIQRIVYKCTFLMFIIFTVIHLIVDLNKFYTISRICDFTLCIGVLNYPYVVLYHRLTYNKWLKTIDGYDEDQDKLKKMD